MFQRVKELEDENEMLKEKVQVLEESSVRLTNFYLSLVLVFRSYLFFLPHLPGRSVQNETGM